MADVKQQVIFADPLACRRKNPPPQGLITQGYYRLDEMESMEPRSKDVDKTNIWGLLALRFCGTACITTSPLVSTGPWRSCLTCVSPRTGVL
jgi:hypothetical protein